MSFAPIKTAVLGVGLAGLTFHAPFVLALPELFTLHAVLERSPAGPGGKLQARFGPEAAKGVKIYNTLDAVLADPEIELVIVGTPNDTHYDFAKRVLEAGKHGASHTILAHISSIDFRAALVDKPVTATSTQALELDQLAKSKGLVLYPYQNRRWDSDFLALQALLRLPPSDPNSLGTLWEFESRFDRYRTTLKGTWKDVPAPSSGLTYDLAAHTIDQALVLFGRPTSVTARVENLRGVGHPDVDDSVRAPLRVPAQHPWLTPARSSPSPSATRRALRPRTRR